MKCFICDKNRNIILPETRDLEEVKIKVKKLRKLGFTMREIMRVFNYKSPRSISKLLK